MNINDNHDIPFYQYNDENWIIKLKKIDNVLNGAVSEFLQAQFGQTNIEDGLNQYVEQFLSNRIQGGEGVVLKYTAPNLKIGFVDSSGGGGELSTNSLFRLARLGDAGTSWLSGEEFLEDGGGTYYQGNFGGYREILPDGISIGYFSGTSVLDGEGEVLYIDGFSFGGIGFPTWVDEDSASLLTAGNNIRITGKIDDIQNISTLTLQFVFTTANDWIEGGPFLGEKSIILDESDASGFVVDMTIPLEYDYLTDGNLGLFPASAHQYNPNLYIEENNEIIEAGYRVIITSIEVVE